MSGASVEPWSWRFYCQSYILFIWCWKICIQMTNWIPIVHYFCFTKFSPLALLTTTEGDSRPSFPYSSLALINNLPRWMITGSGLAGNICQTMIIYSSSSMYEVESWTLVGTSVVWQNVYSLSQQKLSCIMGWTLNFKCLRSNRILSAYRTMNTSRNLQVISLWLRSLSSLFTIQYMLSSWFVSQHLHCGHVAHFRRRVDLFFAPIDDSVGLLPTSGHIYDKTLTPNHFCLVLLSAPASFTHLTHRFSPATKSL